MEGATMKAAVLEEVGRLVVKEVPRPKPKPNEVLVRVHYCGICGTDLKLFEGTFTGKLPLIPGHEFAGEVAEVGEAVEGVEVGDRVVVDPNESCGKCWWCRNGKPVFCPNMLDHGVMVDAGFAEFAVAGQSVVYKVPENVSLLEAAFCEPLSCAIHAVDRAGIRPGESVAVIGGGPAGQILLQLAKAAGADPLIMLTRSPWKLELAKSLGATHVFSPKEGDPVKFVKDLTNGRGADVVIEAAGHAETFEMALDLAAPTGRVVLFGQAGEGEKATVSPFQILTREVTIIPAWLNPYTFHRALKLLADGTVKVKPLATHIIPLDEVERGLRLLKENPPGFVKAVVKCIQ